MTEEKKRKESGEISRREFLKDAGLVVGGAAIGSTVLLAACGGEETTKTVTTTAPGGTATQTKTVTETISNFVCPFCGTEYVSLTELQAHSEVAHPAEKLTELTVNGEIYRLKVEPQWVLTKVLREQLGLIGVKRGCEQGACGVCTVLIDGKPTLSCMTLAVECEGRSIETIESLAPDGVTLHPIQQAFIENFGFECGYCTPGIILVTKALLSENPNPTEEEARKALAGNLCKCGGYQQIASSVLAAAEKM